MRLRRLTINALPGITPGFTFAPPDAGVILITGPNAIGKSSLARALKHLLGGVDRRGDPPALSLAAEFDIGGSRWQVTRNGGQVVWMRDGESTTSPSLPSAGQISLCRLSMESLLADDQSDQALAEALWRALRGGFDLDAPRIALGSRWGRKEEGALSKARSDLGNVERRYAALRSDEAKLPALDRDIKAAQRAAERLEQLQQAMQLHRAIDLREDLHDAVKRFPPDMDKLKGNELERLEACDAKDAELRKRMQDAQRKLQDAQAERQDSGLADAAPEAETVARVEARLNALDRHAGDRAHAEKDATEAEAALQAAQAQFQGSGEAPNLSADSLEQARAIVEPLVDVQARLRELQQQLKLAGEPPDDAEIDQHRAGVDALRTWLATIAQPSPTRQGISSAIWLMASALAAIAAAVALIERAWSGLAAIAAAGLGLVWALVGQAKRTGRASSAADDAMKAFMNTELNPPKEWSSTAVQEHLRRTVEPRLNELILQRERASVAPKLRVEIEDAQSTIERLGKEKAELAKAIGFNPELAGPPFYRLVEVASQWDQARKQCEASKLALAQLDRKIAAEAGEARRFLERWRTAEAPPFDATTSNAAIEELRIAFNHLKRRLDAANDAQGKVASCQREVESLERQVKGVEKDVQGLLAEAALETHQRDELAGRIEGLAQWKEAFDKLTDAKREESRLRSALAEHAELIAAVESGKIEQLKDGLERARSKADTYTDVIKKRQRIETQLDEAGREQGGHLHRRHQKAPTHRDPAR